MTEGRMTTHEKIASYTALLKEIEAMVQDNKVFMEQNNKLSMEHLDTEIAATMRELRQFIERLRRVKEGE